MKRQPGFCTGCGRVMGVGAETVPSCSACDQSGTPEARRMLDVASEHLLQAERLNARAAADARRARELARKLERQARLFDLGFALATAAFVLSLIRAVAILRLLS